MPAVRIDVTVRFTFAGDPVVTICASRLRYNAGIVTAARQHKCDVRVHEKIELERGAPGCHVVGLRADNKHWHAYITQCHRPTGDLITTFRQSFCRNSLRRYSLCMRQGMRVLSAFQANRSNGAWRSPIR